MTEVRSLDLTGATAPALSTTSDMPQVGVKKDPPKGAISQEEIDRGDPEKVAAKAAEETAAAEAAKKAKEKPDDKVDDDKGEKKPEEVEDEDKTPPWAKREITKARNRQREAEATAKAAEDRAKAAEERFDKAMKALEKTGGDDIKTKDVKPRPTRDKFDNPDEYETALITWTTEVAARETQARIEREALDRKNEETAAERKKAEEAHGKAVFESWEKSKAEAMAKYDDWEAVAQSDAVPISPSMAVAIMEVNRSKGNGGEIAYWLGKNIAESERISKITSNEDVLIEIAQISAQLKTQPKKEITKAPPPPKPLSGTRESADRGSAEPSMEEYAAKRIAALKTRSH